jgi:hypothetical protein
MKRASTLGRAVARMLNSCQAREAHQMQQQTLRSILAAVVALAAIASFTVVYSGATSGAPAADPHVSVQCEPAQRAVIRESAEADGAMVVACVTDGTALAATAAAAPRVVWAPAAQAPVTQAAYVPAAAQVYAPAAAPVAAPVLQPTSPAPARGGSTWQKRVLVIGGAAGAGAGVGAIAGGKKGALIGAAIGGGGATLIDVLRNKGR